MKSLTVIFTAIVTVGAFAQRYEGVVYEVAASQTIPLQGANVYTLDLKHGTTTNQEGYFEIKLPKSAAYKRLVVSYIGLVSDTILLSDINMNIYLAASHLQEVVIEKRKFDRSLLNPYDIQIIDANELTKAACCNLSEAFETTASVDVGYADAVTGSKEIKMLGLDGYYSQILFENMPSVRGLANSYGLLFIPGPWMESISINKGAGSVVNGYESITGQINYEYKKPDNGERFYLNLFGSRHGQFEINTNASHRFSDKWSSAWLVHGMMHEVMHDENDDTFQDVPFNERVNVLNRWKYNSGSVFRSQFGVNYIYDEKTSGQFQAFTPETPANNLYDVEVINRRYEAFAKTGFVFKKSVKSVGIQYRFYRHDQHGWYGNRNYTGKEYLANVNAIFQTTFKNPFHGMKAGASYMYNSFDETTNHILLGRDESVPGIFTEYMYQDQEKWAAVIGARIDHNNIHGFWISPRATMKYTFYKNWTVKLSAGRGYRTANVFAENIDMLVSARKIMLQDDLGFESAWNSGISLTNQYRLGAREGSISIDYYRTDFTNQVVIDFETPQQVNIYDLEGRSYSNSFQTEVQFEVVHGLDIKAAYKLEDVKMTYRSGLKRVPYLPIHKGLFVVDYQTKNQKWKFNATGQVRGKARLPYTGSNPAEYVRSEESPAFFTLNSQITTIINKWELYVGAENMTNFWQENPIIASEDPFGPYFDASMIWGPLGGPRLYAGFRFTVPYKEKHNNAQIHSDLENH